MRVLIADDDPTTRAMLQLYCRGADFEPVFAKDGRQALNIFLDQSIDAVVTDVRMPDVMGTKLLADIKKSSPDTPVLLMTAHASIDDAVQCLKEGADDYITKPITREVFVHRLTTVLKRVALVRELNALREQAKAQPLSAHTRMVGSSPVMKRLMAKLPMTAKTDAAVIVYGESGTGKELVAESVHKLSGRAKKAFVTVNCGALPDTLLESELFGYKRGAFTDAHRDTPGLVQEAEGGTLFLDEIGEISPAVQAKLLRFLQSKEYKALGSPRSHTADVRIVSATNRDLKKMVAEGTFREDLYYRLNIIPLQVPPLRERAGDVPLLADFFLQKFNRAYGREIRGFEPEVMAELSRNPWPGNVRELENRVQQLVVLAPTDTIRLVDLTGEEPEPLPAEIADVGSGRFKDEKRRVVDAFERTYIQQMLEETDGNLSEAARRAGMHRKNLWTLAKKHLLLGVGAA